MKLFVIAVLALAAWASIFMAGAVAGVAWSDERRSGRLEMLECMENEVLDQFGPAVEAAVFAEAIHARCKP